MHKRTLALAVAGFVACSADARAATPTLLSVGHDAMHPTATFVAPAADSVTVYISTEPDRATDGRFLTENSAGIDFLTDSEIALGNWMDADQLKPGTYFVMLNAETYSCPEGADCMNGFSNVLTLTIPKPKPRFRAKIERDFISSFTLTATPLGESVPYKLCWTAAKGRKCAQGRVDGTDWNDSASDTIYLTVSDLKIGNRKKITFTWHVAGKRVASKIIRRR